MMRQSTINRRLIFTAMASLVMLFSSGSSFATSALAARAAAFCAPAMTVPNVGSCSTCHTSLTGRGVGDLTPGAGQASLAGNDAFFCPAASNPPSTPPATPPPADTVNPNPPTTGMGMSGGTTPAPGLGMGVGGSMSDDDDDDDHDDDDDDDDDGMVGAVMNLLGFGNP